MKVLLAVLLVCASGLFATIVTGQEQSRRPPNVVETDWIPLGDKFGFAISRAPTTREPDTLVGHFYALHEGTWKIVDNEGGFRIQPLR